MVTVADLCAPGRLLLHQYVFQKQSADLCEGGSYSTSMSSNSRVLEQLPSGTNFIINDLPFIYPYMMVDFPAMSIDETLSAAFVSGEQIQHDKVLC